MSQFAHRLFLFSVIFAFCHSANGQRNRTEPRKRIERIDDKERFSFYQKIGYLKTQVDGDNLRGFDKRGFEIATGVNYKLSSTSYLNIGVQYMKLGSTKPDPYENSVYDQIQLGADLNTFGAQFGIVLRPKNEKVYVSNSFLFNRVTKFSALTYSVGAVEVAPLTLEQTINNSFWSFELVLGVNITDNLAIYSSVLFSMSNILKEDFQNLRVIRPYHLGFGLSYRIVP